MEGATYHNLEIFASSLPSTVSSLGAQRWPKSSLPPTVPRARHAAKQVGNRRAGAHIVLSGFWVLEPEGWTALAIADPEPASERMRQWLTLLDPCLGAASGTAASSLVPLACHWSQSEQVL